MQNSHVDRIGDHRHRLIDHLIYWQILAKTCEGIRSFTACRTVSQPAKQVAKLTQRGLFSWTGCAMRCAGW